MVAEERIEVDGFAWRISIGHTDGLNVGSEGGKEIMAWGTSNWVHTGVFS